MENESINQHKKGSKQSSAQSNVKNNNKGKSSSQNISKKESQKKRQIKQIQKQKNVVHKIAPETDFNQKLQSQKAIETLNKGQQLKNNADKKQNQMKDYVSKQTTADTTSNPNDQSSFQLLPGLQNLGNTCFANSVIQCLSHCHYLQSYCITGRHCGVDYNKLSQESHNYQFAQCLGCKSKIRETKEFKEAWDGCIDKFNTHGVMARAKVWQVVKESEIIQTSFNKENFCSFCIMEYHVKLSSHLAQHHINGSHAKININGQIISPGSMMPLSVIIFIKRLSEEFQIGR